MIVGRNDTGVADGRESGGGKLDPATLQAGKDFEAMAIGEFLQPMFQAAQDADGLFGGGPAESTLKPMLVTEYAKLIEARGGIGLADPIAEKLALTHAPAPRR